MASLSDALERVLPVGEPKPKKIPGDIEERIKRGRARMRQGAPERSMFLRFARAEQYAYVNSSNELRYQPTSLSVQGEGKPRHRVRQTRNILVDHIEAEVAAATQRVPAYEINPSTSDPDDVAAARLSGKIARYGYEKWNIRGTTERVVRYAVVADEGFAWPYWDSSVGPYVTDENGKLIGEGEVCIRVFGPNETYWEPGLKFDESPWHAVEQARTLESVMQMEGYIGGNLKADASADEYRSTDANAKLVLVTEYLERPCPKYPEGRWLTLANEKVIVPERPFPCVDNQGRVVDEPVLHKLSYIMDPESDRDQGLVRHGVDAQRTINDCTNKELEWKNLALVPQLVLQNVKLRKGERVTDEPGQVIHVEGSGEANWREVPQVPEALSRLKEEAKEDLARIFGQNDIPSQVESGRGIEALLEKDRSRHATFISNLAQFHARLMRHCLYLVQKHYTEPRLIVVQGKRGPSLISGFKGADLHGQADVQVLPGSIEPRTRESITQLVMAYADRGWIDPATAIKAIDNGTAEGLLDSMQLDESRANEVIQAIEDGTFEVIPPRPVFLNEQYPMLDPMTGEPVIDPMTGMPQMLTEVPGWMPRPFDRVPVHKAVFEDFMKSAAWSLLDDLKKQAGMFYYDALLRIEAEQQQRAMMAQEAQAEQLGMGNASKPQKATPNPDMPSATASGEVYGPRYQAGSQQTF